jgi:hypothetical protein
MIDNGNPVEYIDKECGLLKFAGYTNPGWYFWDETWSNCNGPYESKNVANEKLEQYFKEYLE